MTDPTSPLGPPGLRRWAVLGLVFASVLATGAGSGAWTSSSPSSRSSTTSLPTSKESEARDLVSRSGDRWAAAYSAQEYEGLRQTLDGTYVGVGLWITQQRQGRIEVSQVQAGSPAQRAGIRAGDRLHSVDGEKVTGEPVTEVVARLRGRGVEDAGPGSEAALGLERGERRWTETLQRARLSAEPVTVLRTSTAPAVIKVESFTKGSGASIQRAARESAGSGIVLDLRGNPGGLLTEAVAAASAFLDEGVVASYEIRGGQRTLNAEPGGDTRTPLVVLVDGGTMSAAELLTGALQDRGRAVVVGTRTFGKGSVQMPSTMADGSVAELTVGQYRTPSGRSLEGRGLVPDLDVSEGSEAEAQARQVLSGLAPGV